MPSATRVRSPYFVATGGVGGLFGFAVMEATLPGDRQATSSLVQSAIYFCGFGAAVGAALGATEGLVLRLRYLLLYGLCLGLALGLVGGFVGGGVGQAIFNLMPIKRIQPLNADIALVLDESGSMGHTFLYVIGFGNDAWGERKKASKRLVEQLAATDRVAVVGFSDKARKILPLTQLSDTASRARVASAIESISDSGGTDLNAGLLAGMQTLVSRRVPGRQQFMIFLTDGAGFFDDRVPLFARKQGIKIFSVGLGSDVDQDILARRTAGVTGGAYFPVARAPDLSLAFQSIVRRFEAGAMTRSAPTAGPTASPFVMLAFRLLSWAAMGLLIGAGQGVRENTREDLLACAVGGLAGGAVGGALFDPMSSILASTNGLVGRAIADVVVGACIGGSIRFAQSFVSVRTGLLAFLPHNEDAAFATAADVASSGGGVFGRAFGGIRSAIDGERRFRY